MGIVCNYHTRIHSKDTEMGIVTCFEHEIRSNLSWQNLIKINVFGIDFLF